MRDGERRIAAAVVDIEDFNIEPASLAEPLYDRTDAVVQRPKSGLFVEHRNDDGKPRFGARARPGLSSPRDTHGIRCHLDAFLALAIAHNYSAGQVCCRPVWGKVTLTRKAGPRQDCSL